MLDNNYGNSQRISIFEGHQQGKVVDILLWIIIDHQLKGPSDNNYYVV
jgi:hypothetical protein